MAEMSTEFKPEGTFIRVKRRRDIEPQDTLVVSSKRFCTRSEEHEKPLDYSVFQRLDTVSEEESNEANVKKALAKNHGRIMACKLKFKSGFQNTIRDKMRNATKESSESRRYLLTACNRKLNEEGTASIDFKMFQASSTAEDPDYVSKLEEVLTGVVETDVDTAAELNKQFEDLTKNDVITCNGVPMLQNKDFVYDLYYHPNLLNLCNGLENTFQSFQFTNNNNMLEYRDNGDISDSNTDSDSNAEDFYANDYGDSDYEGMCNSDDENEIVHKFDKYEIDSDDNYSLDEYNDGDFDESGNLISFMYTDESYNPLRD